MIFKGWAVCYETGKSPVLHHGDCIDWVLKIRLIVSCGIREVSKGHTEGIS
jgi:hypothetical protein